MIECKVVFDLASALAGKDAPGAPTAFVALPSKGESLCGRDGSRYRVTDVEHSELDQPRPIAKELLDRLGELAGLAGQAQGRVGETEAALIDTGLQSLGDAIHRRSRATVPFCTIYVAQTIDAAEQWRSEASEG